MGDHALVIAALNALGAVALLVRTVLERRGKPER